MGALHGCHTVKFDCCNNLWLSIHTILVIVLQSGNLNINKYYYNSASRCHFNACQTVMIGRIKISFCTCFVARYANTKQQGNLFWQCSLITIQDSSWHSFYPFLSPPPPHHHHHHHHHHQVNQTINNIMLSYKILVLFFLPFSSC